MAQKREEAEKSLKQLIQQEFDSNEAAESAIATIEKQWEYHQAKVELEKVFHYQQPGRPKKGQKAEYIKWKVVGQVVDKEEAIVEVLKSKGKFVLGSNELDEEQLPAQMILTVYKGQAASVERGFRFLKDPMFFASSLFLEKPERIMY